MDVATVHLHTDEPNVLRLSAAHGRDALGNAGEAARFTRVILMLDPDEAGRGSVAAILPRLAKSSYLRDIVPEKQPDEMTAEEIKALICFC